MSAISDVFAARREASQLAFMPFLTAGDPDMSATVSVIRALGEAGSDLIEVGFPYSDPIADGPVIQSSYTRALSKNLKVEDIFDSLGPLQSDALPPRVGMVSYAIVHRMGVVAFFAAAKAAGFSGLILPDLPGTEAGETLEIASTAGLDLIQLVAPTTPRDRAAEIVTACTGFVYCVAVAGVTGERAKMADALLEQLGWLREETDLPLAVGFGISEPKHVEPLRGLADGVIVGSGIVRRMEALSAGGSVDDLADFARAMADACHV